LSLAPNVVGAEPLSFQWWKDGQPLVGATERMLVLPDVQWENDGEYGLTVSNSFGAFTTRQGRVVVLIRPVITVQPLSQEVVAGGSVTLSATATGNPLPLSFRWRKGGQTVALLDVPGTNCFLELTNLQPNSTTNRFLFTVVATNLAGSGLLSSTAYVTVLPDEDGDGLPDDWEVAHGFSSADPADAAQDLDGDGFTNLQEYEAGTDPGEAASYLRIEELNLAWPGRGRVRFVARAHRTYTLQARSSLGPAASWHSVADFVAVPTNSPAELDFPLEDGRFFRLVTPRRP
jgi:hypothetical protein